MADAITVVTVTGTALTRVVKTEVTSGTGEGSWTPTRLRGGEGIKEGWVTLRLEIEDGGWSEETSEGESEGGDGESEGSEEETEGETETEAGGGGGGTEEGGSEE